jgi:putative ABC transport system substrate-binding protein
VGGLLLFGQVCQAGPREVVVVQSADIRPFDEAREGFESACGCDIKEVFVSAGRSGIAGDVARLRPDAVVAIGMDALTALQSVRNVPVFYTMAAGTRPVSQELHNFSGVSMFIPPERQLDMIRELFPKAKRIGLIFDARNTAPLVDRIIHHGQANNMEIVFRRAETAGDVPRLLEALQGKIDVFLMLPDVTVVTPKTVDLLMLFSFRNRIPVFTFSEKYLDVGAVAALVVSPRDLGAQTGEIARERLKHTSAAAPVRAFARKHILMVNATVAKKLGIVIRDEILKKSVVFP